MHPGSKIQTWSDNKLTPVERHSLTDGGLEAIYKQSKELAVARGNLPSRNFNAKEAGTEPGGAVDAINGSVPTAGGTYVGNDVIQANFKIKQQVQVTQFTKAGLNYSTDVWKVNTKKYYTGGL